MLDIHQLAVIAGVARAGSYTAAAELLGYTQPAVSYRMRSLERTIGVQLAVRSGRGVRLTPAGRRLAQHAEVVLSALGAVEDEFRTYAAHARGMVRVSAIHSACASLLPGAVARLRSARPDVQVVLERATSPDAYRSLRDGTTDVALVSVRDGARPDAPDTAPDAGPGTDPGAADAAAEPGPPEAEVVDVPLISDPRCVLLPVDHPLADLRTIPLSALADESWVLDEERDEFTAACARAGFEPRTVAITNDPATAHDLVAHGVGAAVAEGLALPPRPDPRVVARPLRGWPPRRVHALLRAGTTRAPAVEALLTALREAVEDHRAANGDPAPLRLARTAEAAG
ncbi:LysR family transcriptional regulator [Streptomyces botrytidirepellens]|uniref:LysR family transcriptional regulator n=1 Tax=Streptomyces botrytidirepellens TaxID=2486417 RepID=A0A3M8WF78_9ACTN|nr:LysR family transcriptional regulator [Streptomyces botrytidirepellens]RNG27381.1 LysR family transcriptional regulator [Streptomyces botrytidirepellens]